MANMFIDRVDMHQGGSTRPHNMAVEFEFEGNHAEKVWFLKEVCYFAERIADKLEVAPREVEQKNAT